MIDPEEIPKTPTVTYVKEKSVTSQKATALPMIIFCIDTSGSMAVTTNVKGGVAVDPRSTDDKSSRVEYISRFDFR
jgi:hypothetical protein